MDVNEWMSYECSDEGTYIHNIHNSSTRSHASEDENRTRYRSKNCKCKRKTGLKVRTPNRNFVQNITAVGNFKNASILVVVLCGLERTCPYFLTR